MMCIWQRSYEWNYGIYTADKFVLQIIFRNSISRCLRWAVLALAVAKLAETSRKLLTSALEQSTSSVDVLICDSVVVRLEIEMFQRMKQHTYLYSMATVG